MSSEQIMNERIVASGNGATYSAIMQLMIAQQSSETITWFIDRVGNQNINTLSINTMDTNNNRISDSETSSLDDLINNDSQSVLSPLEDDDWLNYSNSSEDDFLPFSVEENISVEVEVVTNMEITEEEKDCCVCQEDIECNEICRLNCAHKFCGDCVKNVMNTRQKKCPLCRAEISKISVQTEKNLMKIHRP